MSLKCGIVGLPNIGKSTLFNALGSATAACSNYPFCTIEPNVAIVNLPDPILEKLGLIFQPEKVTPATTKIVDIAGIVKGASQGAGLGNQFLSHVREVDAIVHLVRCFQDDDVSHVDGSIDPGRDIETINTELLLADLQTVDKRLEKARKAARVGDKEAGKEATFLELVHAHLNGGRPARSLAVDSKSLPTLDSLFLLTRKPALLVANSRGASQDEPFLASFSKAVAREGTSSLVLDCKLEAEITELPEQERKEYLQALGLAEPGLHRFIRAVCELLGLVTFYTVVGPEVRAWTTPRGTHAPQAAGLIHTDFEKGFIRAECYKSEDLLRLGGEAKVREAGLYRIEGKEYIVGHGDVIFFRFHT